MEVTECVETPMNPGIGPESEPNAPHNLWELPTCR
jgi:hypothetical protein